MNKRNEKISAYLDGEIHQDEIMSFSLSAENDDALTSIRYQLIGEALRGEVTELSMLDVSVAVREELADENIVDQLGEQATRVGAAISPANGAEPSAPSGSGLPGRLTAGRLITSWLTAGWLRPVGGIAVAATVAVVMIAGVRQQNQQSGDQIATIQPVVPATVVIASENPLQTVPAQTIPPIDNSELNPYLNQHFATQGTLQSRMPYVRAVSYESGR